MITETLFLVILPTAFAVFLMVKFIRLEHKADDARRQRIVDILNSDNPILDYKDFSLPNEYARLPDLEKSKLIGTWALGNQDNPPSLFYLEFGESKVRGYLYSEFLEIFRAEMKETEALANYTINGQLLRLSDIQGLKCFFPEKGICIKMAGDQLLFVDDNEELSLNRVPKGFGE